MVTTKSSSTRVNARDFTTKGDITGRGHPPNGCFKALVALGATCGLAGPGEAAVGNAGSASALLLDESLRNLRPACVRPGVRPVHPAIFLPLVFKGMLNGAAVSLLINTHPAIAVHFSSISTCQEPYQTSTTDLQQHDRPPQPTLDGSAGQEY